MPRTLSSAKGGWASSSSRHGSPTSGPVYKVGSLVAAVTNRLPIERAPDSWLKVQTTLNAMNATAERWTTNSFLEATPEFIAELQGAVRIATVVARAKFGFLDSVPYLISRLGQLESYSDAGSSGKRARHRSTTL